jgi:hypothetical protein
VKHVRVQIDRSAAQLDVRYVLEGDLDALLIPALVVSLSQRVDKLWQHTCFEIFLASSESDEYCEFNFSPSTQWAAYSFASYRTGMRDLDVTPVVRLRRHPHAAVIELDDGAISYWALAHPGGKPDFHHRDGFVLKLPRQ